MLEAGAGWGRNQLALKPLEVLGGVRWEAKEAGCRGDYSSDLVRTSEARIQDMIVAGAGPTGFGNIRMSTQSHTAKRASRR